MTVKRWKLNDPYPIPDPYPDGQVEVVLASDYDAIEAELARVRHATRFEIYETLLAENARLTAWVADLQSGMYVNCVYCGFSYGPGETTPVSMADALKAHVEQCPKHPMSELVKKYGEALVRIEELEAWKLPPKNTGVGDDHDRRSGND